MGVVAGYASVVHNPGDAVKVGDTVTIVATRPISKLKHFAIDPAKTVSVPSEND
ncbi:MAG: 30S ribosomal protein S17 [Parcubacteria group bacterium 20-58-5]|nr:MAG: 30S ribosomal protein S17 [Parcubacteria group bacterium 20-58-5]